MVEKILNFLHKELNGLHQVAFLLASAAVASQLLALVRDRLLAARFGAGLELDIYYAAFRLPDLVFATLVSLVSVTVLIPFLIEKLKTGHHQSAQAFLNSLLTVFLFLMVLVSVVLLIVMPTLAPLVAPGFSGAAQKQLVLLSRILLLSPLLLGLSNLFGAVTQSLGRFFVYALGPVLYNLGIILGICLFEPFWGLAGLTIGVVLGALAHCLIHLPVMVRNGLLPRLTGRPNFRETNAVFSVSVPRSLALASNQLALLVLVALASFLGAGSIAVLNFALNLQSVPLVIVGVSYSVAAFPALAKLFAAGDKTEFMKQIAVAIRHILFWSLLATVLFIVLRAQIVRVILGAGRFDWQDTRLTAAALALFILSVAGQGLIQLFIRGYYACGKTRRPLLLNALAAAVIIGLGFILSKLFVWSTLLKHLIEAVLRVTNINGTAVLMLPLAYSLGVMINLFLFWFFFQKDFGPFPKIVDRSLVQSFFASLIAGLVSYQLLNILDNLFNINTFLGIFAQGLFAGLSGIVIFFLVLKWWRNKEVAELQRSLWVRFWKIKPALVPEKEEL